MSESKLPESWFNPESGMKETVIKDEASLDAVLAEFREQPLNPPWSEYDNHSNLRKLLLLAERFNRGIVTWSILVKTYRSLIELNRTRKQTGDLEFIPIVEIEERERKVKNDQLRQIYGEYQRFFDSCTSAQNREREKTDLGYKKYVERQKKTLSGPANPIPIVSELFPAPITSKVRNEPVLGLSEMERAELEDFAARFRSLTSGEARQLASASFSGQTAADEFNSLATRAQKAGILRTYSNL